MKKYTYRYFNRTSKSAAKFLNSKHNYMTIIQRRKLKNLATAFIIVTIIITFSILALLASEQTFAAPKEATATSAVLHSGKAGNDYKMPDPCALKDIICANEIKPASKKPAMPSNKSVKQSNAKIPKITKDVSTGKIDANKVKPIKIDATAKQQEIIDYTWTISKDKDFIYTLEIEGAGKWDIKLRSYIKGNNGYYDWGIAQINEGYHKKIVRDPKFFIDYKFQLDNAWRLYKGGTKFYGFNHRQKAISKFKWVESKDFKMTIIK